MRTRHLLLLLGLTGCINFEAARLACEDAGTCAARPTDGGGTPIAPEGLARVETSTGWRWDYPLPAGTPLVAVAAVGPDEFWAAGADQLLLHYRAGEWTGRHLPAGSSTNTLTCVMPLADGRVVTAGSEAAAYTVLLDGGVRTHQWQPFRPISTCALSDTGVAWWGGRQEYESAGTMIAEGEQGERITWLDLDATPTITALSRDGWALVGGGGVLRAQADGGWARVGTARLDGGEAIYQYGSIVGAGPDSAWVGGENDHLTLLSLDGTRAEVSTPTFTPHAPFPIWAGLARDGTSALAVSSSGLARCRVEAGAPTCDVEHGDPNTSLVAVSAQGGGAFAVGLAGQVLRMVDAGVWAPMGTELRAPVTNLFFRADGGLLAVTGHGRLLSRTAAGWDERVIKAGVGLNTLWEDETGTVLLAGDDYMGVLGPSGDLQTAVMYRADGGHFTVQQGAGWMPAAIRGRGDRVWLVGAHAMLYRWHDNAWYEEQLPGDPGDFSFSNLFVTDAGTAWAVGGQQLYWFDGSAWQDVSPSVAHSDFAGAWGPSPAELFVAGYDDHGVHRTPDGGWQPWTMESGLNLSSLSGRVEADGGVTVVALHGDVVGAWHQLKPGGADGLREGAPLGPVGYGVRVFARQGRIWAVGPRREELQNYTYGYVLSGMPSP